MTKINLKIVIDQAHHFLKWELPYFEKEFELVDEANENTVLLAFGPDVLATAANLPALKRVALLFPGFGFNPLHNLDTREESTKILKEKYDLLLTNPGPIYEAFKESTNVIKHPFSINVEELVKFRRIRKSIKSLIHISADSFQKDWERSQQVMSLTKLKYEVFPYREKKITLKDRLHWRYQRYIVQRFNPEKFRLFKMGYTDHSVVMRKYKKFDGFVHIAAEKPHHSYIDGKYTASLLEAGATGAIVFWHDTLSLGNDFESVFSLSKEPEKAAKEINQIRQNVDIAKISRQTQEEIYEVCHPRKVVSFRRKEIEKIL